MGSLGRNQALALDVVGRLRASGVGTFCLCPGGRNAPLVEVLDALAPAVEVLGFFEERSAAFFALGRARRDDRPVAVVTTSGTAASEVLPAMIEAHYSAVPLIAVTADRPAAYRGTGAPQAIEQEQLFGVYARLFLDVDAPGVGWTCIPRDCPSHVNVSFDEPLLAGWQDVAASDQASLVPSAARAGNDPSTERGGGDRAEADPGDDNADADVVRAALGAAIDDALHGCRHPVVLLGALSAGADREASLDFCRRLGAPVLAEASSHLRHLLGPLLLRGGEGVVRRAFEQGLFDSVVRLGGVPSCRLWRDLETAAGVPVLSVSRKPWPGLTRGLHVQAEAAAPLSAYLPGLAPFPERQREAVMAEDARSAAATEALLDEFPMSEAAHVRRLSLAIPHGSFVYLGNSQPIREWNRFAAVDDRRFSYGENRGANGIDGQLSAFLGEASPGRENWAIVGDLTALYDLASPWALAHVSGPVRVVVLNNGGGRIFERMFGNPRFQNRHALSFEAWAALWGMDYRREAGTGWSPRPCVVEIRPDDGQTQAFWQALSRRKG